MREIKFRAWVNGEMIPADIAEVDISLRGLTQTENYILMQYTGLHDKDGKEIYEGDIVEERVKGMGTGRVFLVRWDDEDLTYKVGAAMLGGEDVKVIGTVQENPDLLKSPGK